MSKDRAYYFKNRKWTEEQENWLIEHKNIRGKKAMHEAFYTAFPDATFTDAAISTKRTELGAYGTVYDWRHRTARPLYSETVKQGYVMIKVSSHEWWQKQKWVWVETHPGEPFTIRNQFVFLDGDNRNFSPDNIWKVDHRIIGLMNRTYGGFQKGHPEENLIKLLQAEMKLKTLDLGDELGLTVNYGVGRVLKSERNRKAREYNAKKKATWTKEQHEAFNKSRAEYVAKRKREDPEYKAKLSEYQRNWARKKKERLQNERSK